MHTCSKQDAYNSLIEIKPKKDVACPGKVSLRRKSIHHKQWQQSATIGMHIRERVEERYTSARENQ
jgi:hypothetical protein